MLREEGERRFAVERFAAVSEADRRQVWSRMPAARGDDGVAEVGETRVSHRPHEDGLAALAARKRAGARG